MIGYQFLLEVDALYQNIYPTTLRFCCQPGYVGGGVEWLPRIINPGIQQINLFSGGKTTGASSQSNGSIELGNFKAFEAGSGPIDHLREYTFYGRPVRMYYGPMDAAFPAGFTLGYTAVVGDMTFTWDTISLSLKGRQAELSTPFSTGTFGGTNVLPNGVDGTTDLKDKDKPAIIGRVFNISPVLCNSSKLIYSVSELTGLSIDEFGSNLFVYDEGVQLFCAGKVANIETTSPPEGQWTVSNGFIRLGSRPAGQITVSGAAQGYALMAHPAKLISQILTLSGHADMIDTASFADYALIDRAERGIFLTGKPNISQLIDRLISPCGFWYHNAAGKIILGVMADPSTLTPVYALSTSNNSITKFARRKPVDTKDGVPASYVTLKYGQSYTVQTQPAGSVDVARKLRLAEAWLSESANSTNAIHPLSGEFVLETALNNSNPMLLNRVRDLHTADRELIDIDVSPLNFLETIPVLPGQCVSVDLEGRFGYSEKHMIVVGKKIDYAKEIVQMTLWG